MGLCEVRYLPQTVEDMVGWARRIREARNRKGNLGWQLLVLMLLDSHCRMSCKYSYKAKNKNVSEALPAPVHLTPTAATLRPPNEWVHRDITHSPTTATDISSWAVHSKEAESHDTWRDGSYRCLVRIEERSLQCEEQTNDRTAHGSYGWFLCDLLLIGGWFLRAST